jgi:tellurite resistance protein TehA-like permease
VGEIWKAVGVPAGIFLWLLGFWFSALSTVAVISGARKMHFTLNWWGFIFPNAGLTVAAIYIGNALGSGGIKAVTSAMTILLVVAWLVVAVAHIRAVINHQILWPGHDEDMEDIEGHGD